MNSAPLQQVNNINDLVQKVIGIGNTALYLLVAFAVVYIVYHIVFYFIKGDSEIDRKKSGMNILWGIIGLAVIVSLWGLVNIVVRTFYTNPSVPTDKFPTANFVNRNR